jgi:hypothetical protein
MRDLLKSVTEGYGKQIATDPRRFAVGEPPLFTTQFLEAERPTAIVLALDRCEPWLGGCLCGNLRLRFGRLSSRHTIKAVDLGLFRS